MIKTDQDIINEHQKFKKEFNQLKVFLGMTPIIAAFIGFLMGYFFESVTLKEQIVGASIILGISGFFCLFCFLLVYFVDQPVVQGKYNAVIKTRG